MLPPHRSFIAFRQDGPAGTARYSLGYNPRLDGLRAVAVMLVLLSHYGIFGFSGGGYGVDIFFVLSGFLITRILINDVADSGSLFPFYWRRFLRLFPALAWLSLALLLVSQVFKTWIAPETARLDVLASLGYMANWTRALSLGPPQLLGNCWSLAIEEQFYLLWPLVFLLVPRRRQNHYLLAAGLVLLGMSVAWAFRLESQQLGYARIYNGIDTHSSGLLLGCCLALVQRTARGEALCKLAGRYWPLAVVAFAFLVGGRFGTWTVRSSLLADGAAVLLILAACYAPNSPASKMLQLRPMVAVGKISYGLYLWHYPILMALYLNRLPWLWVTGLGIPASFGCAAFSYWFIERPALRFRSLPSLPLRQLGMGAVGLSVAGMLAAGSYFFHETVSDAIFTGPTNIVAYGPHVVQAGGTFNLQSDGESYLWMSVSRTLPAKTKLRIGKWLLETNNSGRSLSVLLPRALLAQIQKQAMELLGPDGQPLGPPVSFEVVASAPQGSLAR
jgi:peptidoglycan/LPS O-acetylase OafA/YrhL